MNAPRLTRSARRDLSAASITEREWSEAFHGPSVTGHWRGDSCGCPDDRCRGYHHEATEPCACLPALIAEHKIEAV